MGVRRLFLLAMSLAAVSAMLLFANVWRSADNADAQDEAHAWVALDMDVTNGSGPCNPVDHSYSVGLGQTYKVAVCLLDASQAPAELDFHLIYNDSLNRCVPQECTSEICVDSNPDANVGATMWGDTSLGTGWDCHYMGESPPTCDSDPAQGEGHGLASLICLTLDEEPSLRVGDGVASPIALVTFEATNPGEDTFSLNDTELFSSNLAAIVAVFGSKNPADEGTVSISTEVTPTSEASPPSETPPAGATPGAETTPGGEVATTEPAVATASAATAVAQGTPIAAINQAATATSAAVATKAASSAKTPTGKATAKPGSTGEESGGSSGPNALLIAGIVAGCVIVAGGAGWFGYRRFRATR